MKQRDRSVTSEMSEGSAPVQHIDILLQIPLSRTLASQPGEYFRQLQPPQYDLCDSRTSTSPMTEKWHETKNINIVVSEDVNSINRGKL